MASPFLTVFHNGFLTLKSISLGRLVPDAKNPGQDFWPQAIRVLDPSLVDERDFEQFHDFIGTSKHAGLWAKVSRLFCSKISSETGASNDLSSSLLKHYGLMHPSDYFQDMCKDKDTKIWIETTLKRFPIFLIVGVLTVREASVSQTEHKKTEAEVSAQVPVSDIVTGGASAALPAAGDATNITLGGSLGSGKTGERTFLAPGERVIGVQYRKLKFGFFSKRAVDEAFLENNPNRWEMFVGGNRAGANHIIEADLQDSVGMKDLELEGDEEVTVSGEFVLVEDGGDEEDDDNGGEV